MSDRIAPVGGMPMQDDAMGRARRAVTAEGIAAVDTSADGLPTPGLLEDGRERKPFGMYEQQLAYPSDPDWRRYWFNDIPGRVQRAADAGYRHVNDRMGSPVARNVDRRHDGGGMKAYLMEIPMRLYQEDMMQAQHDRDRRSAAIQAGSLEQGEESYIPKQGIKIRSGVSQRR